MTTKNITNTGPIRLKGHFYGDTSPYTQTLPGGDLLLLQLVGQELRPQSHNRGTLRLYRVLYREGVRCGGLTAASGLRGGMRWWPDLRNARAARSCGYWHRPGASSIAGGSHPCGAKWTGPKCLL